MDFLVDESTGDAVAADMPRAKDESPSTRVNVVKAFLDQHASELAGNFVVASEATVRIRK